MLYSVRAVRNVRDELGGREELSREMEHGLDNLVNYDELIPSKMICLAGSTAKSSARLRLVVVRLTLVI